MTWQGVSEAECYDNRSVIAQIMRLKDRVRVLEEEGSEEIQHEIELINEQLTILEGKVAGLEEGTASMAEDVAALQSGKADDDAVVKLAGSQTITGVKSFSSSPIVPTPTTSYQAATKKYVDDNAGTEYTAGLGLSISNDVIGIEQNYAFNIVKKDDPNQQTISSSIYFTTIPRAPGTPVNASDLANKQYVDDKTGGVGTWTFIPDDGWTATTRDLLTTQRMSGNTALGYVAKKHMRIIVTHGTSYYNVGHRVILNFKPGDMITPGFAVQFVEYTSVGTSASFTVINASIQFNQLFTTSGSLSITALSETKSGTTISWSSLNPTLERLGNLSGTSAAANFGIAIEYLE
jgi:hypothetical protein